MNRRMKGKPLFQMNRWGRKMKADATGTIYAHSEEEEALFKAYGYENYEDGGEGMRNAEVSEGEGGVHRIHAQEAIVNDCDTELDGTSGTVGEDAEDAEEGTVVAPKKERGRKPVEKPVGRKKVKPKKR